MEVVGSLSRPLSAPFSLAGARLRSSRPSGKLGAAAGGKSSGAISGAAGDAVGVAGADRSAAVGAAAIAAGVAVRTAASGNGWESLIDDGLATVAPRSLAAKTRGEGCVARATAVADGVATSGSGASGAGVCDISAARATKPAGGACTLAAPVSAAAEGGADEASSGSPRTSSVAA